MKMHHEVQLFLPLDATWALPRRAAHRDVSHAVAATILRTQRGILSAELLKLDLIGRGCLSLGASSLE